MSVWLEIPKRRPDGRHRAFGRITMRSAFQISLKFFPEMSLVQTVLPCRPDGRTLAAHNFHIKASCVRTIGMVVRIVDLTHAIFIRVARRPEHEDWRPDVLILNARLALWMSASGRESTSSEQLQLSSHICVLK